MSSPQTKTQWHAKRGEAREEGKLDLAAIGLESEFSIVVNGEPTTPEEVFGSPRAFIRGELMHRKGKSYHLPTGAAVYFDTGVIELATPAIEIEPGCGARAARQLWEALRFVRDELDAWERRTGNDIRLVGFSSHYNVSFEAPEGEPAGRTVERLALLLAYILPAPVMLLATNRRSTGVGVRPRGNRIEITVDFTPSTSLMVATATLVTGIVREVMSWPSYDLELLQAEGLPVFDRFAPMPHTTRKGWLARFDCYPRNPFAEDVNAPTWAVRSGLGGECSTLALREIASRIFRRFSVAIERVSDPFTYRLIRSVLDGRTASLLDLPDRPPEYEDVGRLCRWDNLFPERTLSRSRYERVLMRAISGRALRTPEGDFVPTGMRGWSHVVFRKRGDRVRHVFSIDYLVERLDDWEP